MDCLRNSYKIACDFDLRPGLKFLLQKVAHTPVAVNLYKQAGASMVFYIHTLIKICSNIPELSVEKVKDILQSESKKVTESGQKVSRKLNETFLRTSESSDTTAEQISVEIGASDEVMHLDTKPSLRDDELCNRIEQNDMQASSPGKPNSNNEHTDRQTKYTASPGLGYNTEVESAVKHCSKVRDCPELYLSQLLSVCDELCKTYIDILYDKAGTSCVDSMSEQQLFFLIAQPDELPEVTNKVDLAKLSKDLERTQARFQGNPSTVMVSVQGRFFLMPQYFLPILREFLFFIYIYVVVCKCFQFGPV